MNSTHKVEVVSVKLEKHPDADTLSVVWVDGYSCVVKTLDWEGKTKAAFIPPDNLVPVSKPEFSWLAPKANSEGLFRVKAMKLRGMLSFGLLVPVDESLEVGTDVTEALGVTHYVPNMKGVHRNKGIIMGGEDVAGPPVYTPKYDLEAFRKYAGNVFTEGEGIICQEKVYGCNSRYVYTNGQMYCGSKTVWKREYPDFSHITKEYLLERGVTEEKVEEILGGLEHKGKRKNVWWQALDATPELREACVANPDCIFYGEVYGAVQDLNYGCVPGEVRFGLFDIMKDGKWLDFQQVYTIAKMFSVPLLPLFNPVDKGVVHPIPYNFEKVCQLAEGQSLIPGANHCREGVVVRSMQERTTDKGYRAILKAVGVGYLSRKEVENSNDIGEE